MVTNFELKGRATSLCFEPAVLLDRETAWCLAPEANCTYNMTAYLLMAVA